MPCTLQCHFITSFCRLQAHEATHDIVDGTIPPAFCPLCFIVLPSRRPFCVWFLFLELAASLELLQLAASLSAFDVVTAIFRKRYRHPSFVRHWFFGVAILTYFLLRELPSFPFRHWPSGSLTHSRSWSRSCVSSGKCSHRLPMAADCRILGVCRNLWRST